MPIVRPLCFAAPLALLWVGCVSPDSLNEASAQLGDTPTCASSWVCGSNSPEVDHYGFHELNLEGLANSAGIRIDSSKGGALITKGAKSYFLRVKEAKIFGTLNGQIVLSGLGLVGAEIHLYTGTKADYTIRIEGVRTMPYPVGNTTELVETYVLSWYGGGVLPDAKRNICKFPAILTDPAPLRAVIITLSPPSFYELLGMYGGESVVFEGDRIDAARKTIGQTFEDRWFNIGCAGHTLAKMLLTRHATVAGASTYGISWEDRQATLKLLTADYCGDGTAFTVAGEPLRWTGDVMPYIRRPSQLEARWSSKGADCLNEPRLKRTSSPDAVALFGQDISATIAAHCPNVIPPCSPDVSIDNFNGSLRLSGNP
jgi:ADYC domain